MIQKRLIIAAAALVALSASTLVRAQGDLTAVPAGAYASDPTHSYIKFQYSHLGLSNPIVTFDDFGIDLNLDADPAKSAISVNIQGNSIESGSDIFDEHLNGAKWFDTQAHPTMMFKSTSVSGAGDSYKVTGDLTIKGITKPVTLDVKINAAKDHPMKKVPVIGVSATGMIKRSDWGLGANAPYISDEVTLEIQTELLKG